MFSCIIYDTCIGFEEDLLFWRYIELCVDFLSFLLITWFHRRDIGETSVKHRLKGVEKRLKKITLLAYMFLSELMWSTYSVAMFLICALCCYFSAFHPFEYGIMTLFALSHQKKPPDLVSEGGKIRVCSNYYYDPRYAYFIARQRFLAKVLHNSQMRTIVHREQLRSPCRSSLDVKPAQTVEETLIMEATKLRCTPCTDATDNTPLDDSVQQAPPSENADPVVLLTKENRILDELKSVCWMADGSKKLDETPASVLQKVLKVPICLAPALIAIIFDTGASMSISGELKNFPYGIEKFCTTLQGIGSGLKVTGKGIIHWTFLKVGGGVVTIECMAYYPPVMKFHLFSPQSYFLKQQVDRQFVMNKMGVYFELNEKDCIKIALNAANLPVAIALNTVDVTSENLALYSYATDATNISLPTKAKRLLQTPMALSVGAMQFSACAMDGSKRILEGRGRSDVENSMRCV